MKKIIFSSIIKDKAPSLEVIQINAICSNPPTSDTLWSEIECECDNIRATLRIEHINKLPAIVATRKAYKALGKDPNRYRPSAEALCRRIINKKGIYRLTTLVDIINLISISTGHSIGGFDEANIVGDTLTLDSGKEGEVFNAIGRGPLNIAGLPVYRDASGGIGTPTSDEERTKLTPHTESVLMLVNMYGKEQDPSSIIKSVYSLLKRETNLRSFAATLHKTTGETNVLI